MSPRLLIETSTRGGFAALDLDGDLLARRLDEGRTHARDLASAAKALLNEAGIPPSRVERIIVSLGPGSYTGLRVGLASAKAFAFAVGCPLVAVPTFHAIAYSLPEEIDQADIVADALKGQYYVQRFEKCGKWKPMEDLRIADATGWDWRVADAIVTAVPTAFPFPREVRIVPPGPEGLLRAAEELRPCTREELFALEPIYLRGSSAEELKKAQSVSADNASARVS